jgi:hypothetical protein
VVRTAFHSHSRPDALLANGGKKTEFGQAALPAGLRDRPQTTAVDTLVAKSRQFFWYRPMLSWTTAA